MLKLGPPLLWQLVYLRPMMWLARAKKVNQSEVNVLITVLHFNKTGINIEKVYKLNGMKFTSIRSILDRLEYRGLIYFVIETTKGGRYPTKKVYKLTMSGELLLTQLHERVMARIAFLRDKKGFDVSCLIGVDGK